MKNKQDILQKAVELLDEIVYMQKTIKDIKEDLKIKNYNCIQEEIYKNNVIDGQIKMNKLIRDYNELISILTLKEL